MSSLTDRRTFSRALLCAGAAQLLSCVREPEPRLRLGTFPRPSFEPFFLARSLGSLDNHLVQFVEFPTSAEMLMAYRNGVVDAATVTIDDALRLAADGEAFRIVLLIDYSAGLEAVLTTEDVPDLASIKGKAVAVEANSLGAYVLARALSTVGLTSADVKIVSSRADRMGRDAAVGTVQAVVAYEPYRTKLLARGLVSRFDTSSFAGEITGFLITRAALAENPTSGLRQLAAGWFEALQYLSLKHEDALQRMAPREGLTARQFGEVLKLHHFASREQNDKQLSDHPEAALPGQMARVARLMKEYGLLKRDINPSPLRSDILVRGE